MPGASDDDAQSTRVRPRAAGAPRDRAFRLVVVDGPEKGRSFTVDGSQATRALIGQGAACDVRLGDAEVSRRHAALEIAGAELRVTDLGSTNGTFVDRVRVSEAYLRGGEFLRIGATMFRVDVAEGAEPRALPEATTFGRIVGASAQMRRLYPLCERLARADVPVIIEGETGTGKEVLAESLHEEGPRGDKPFVVFDCTAVAANLIESELFGHERGAFTGATASRAGVFEQAQGGTLFIDEIGDLDPLLQPKLLRAIERAEIRRVGGDRWIKVDVRLLSATRRDLDREVQAGRFREDLFHRLAVARIELPPLRHRTGDVPVLARHFWSVLGGAATPLPDELLARWGDYSWPGNVRELRNAVARQLALGELAAEQGRGPGDGSAPPTSTAADFMDQVVASAIPFPEAREKVIEELEQRYVAAVLARHGGDVAAAAAAAGIGQRYLQKLRARHR
jgi:DNA-binding NtrC family response regulator